VLAESFLPQHFLEDIRYEMYLHMLSDLQTVIIQESLDEMICLKKKMPFLLEK
jgi:hypothetical protein